MEDVTLHLERRKINLIIWVIKALLLVGLFIFVLNEIFTLKIERIPGKATIEFDTRLLGIELELWFYGYLISFILSYFIHLITFSLVKESKPNKKVKNKDLISWFLLKTFFWRLSEEAISTNNKISIMLGVIKGALLKLISPDYSSASTFKILLMYDKFKLPCPRRKSNPHKDKINNVFIQCEDIKGKYNCEIHLQKNRRKDFIIYSNWVNVIFACVICIITMSLEPRGIFLTFLIFHIISRMIEVVIAFYNDVVKSKMNPSDLSIGYKSSNLKRGNRISLALHSYVEFILLFACVYQLTGSNINNVLSGNNMSSFLDYLLYSMSVSAYNFSLDINTTTFGKLVHVSQVFTSMTLIVLSVATYIGMKDEMSKYETIEWDEDDYS